MAIKFCGDATSSDRLAWRYGDPVIHSPCEFKSCKAAGVRELQERPVRHGSWQLSSTIRPAATNAEHASEHSYASAVVEVVPGKGDRGLPIVHHQDDRILVTAVNVDVGRSLATG